MDNVLQITNLNKKYKNFTALDCVNMNVKKGSIYGFIGKNGSGKTTLIRVICGLQQPNKGEYFIYGIQNNDPNITKSRKRIGAVVEVPAVFYDMTATQNLKNQYKLLGLPSYEGLNDILKLVGLNKDQSKKVKNFSLGMRQRLGIAIALVGDPDLLILDEPINGLDPQGIIDIRELILKLNKEKQITVLISSHMLDELSKIATHYGFIDQGKIIRQISASELFASCRKTYRVEVTNIEALAIVLDELGVQYKVISKNIADMYSKVNISTLAINLVKHNCEILSFNERNEDLESYYVNLIGGDFND